MPEHNELFNRGDGVVIPAPLFIAILIPNMGNKWAFL